MLKIPQLIAIVAALGAGIMIAAQSRINGGLGLALGDGVGAALYSFLSGWLLIGLILIFNPRARAGLKAIFQKVKRREVPIWMIFGGAFGGFLVMTQGVAAGVLGISLYTVAVVAGQGVSAIVIDARGWFGVEKRPLHLSRVLGAILVFVGIGLVVENPNLKTIALVVLPLLAGLGLGFQQAANGKVRIETSSVVAATFLNFMMGATFLAILKLFTLPSVGISTDFPSEWWLYVGGFAGVAFIAIQVFAVAKIGVLGLGVLLGTGQLLGSLLVDLLFPVPGQVLSMPHVVGVLIALVGALVVNLRR